MPKSNYIHQLIREGEHQRLDFKFEISDSRKIARSLVAFSNSDGGTLLIGVKDNGVIAGIRSEEEKYMVETAALLYTRPIVHYTAKEWEVEGRTVLEVTIPRSGDVPHYVLEDDGKWMAYIRVKDQNLLANNVLLKIWKRSLNIGDIVIHYTVKEQRLLAYLEENGSITLPELCRIAEISKNRAENMLVDFIRMKIIEMIFTEKEVFYRLNENLEG